MQKQMTIAALVFFCSWKALAIPAHLAVAKDQLDSSSNLTHNINIFGKDDRQVVTKFDLRKQGVAKVVRVALSSGQNCTGFLVARTLVMTNAHCLYDVNVKEKQKGNFTKQAVTVYLAYDNMEFYASAAVLRAWIPKGWEEGKPNTIAQRPYDWAILKLDMPTEEDWGWMGSSNDFDPVKVNKLEFAGFSTDFEKGFKMSHIPSCSIRQLYLNGRLGLHDCDAMAGSSGSPLFKCENDKCVVYAMGSGSLKAANQESNGDGSERFDDYRPDAPNVAVMVKEFFPYLTALYIYGFLPQDLESDVNVFDLKQPNMEQKYCTTIYSPDFKKAKISKINYRVRFCDKKRLACQPWVKRSLEYRGSNYMTDIVCSTSDRREDVTHQVVFDQSAQAGAQLARVNLQVGYFKDLPQGKMPLQFCFDDSESAYFDFSKGNLSLKLGKPPKLNEKKKDCRYFDSP